MPTFPYYLRRFKELGLREATHQAGDILTRGALRTFERVYDRYLRTDLTERDTLSLCGFTSSAALLEHFRTRKAPAFFVGADLDFAIDEFRSQFPGHAEAIIGEADLLMQHRIELLGSGRIDLDKAKRQSSAIGYLPWHLDFKSGTSWDALTYYKNIRYGNQPGVDVKIPWELSRFHHLIRLGQAYRFSDNEAYAQEFVRQVSDWIDTNPARYGVNWSSTMDVGIRAVNWIWALYLFKNSSSVSPEFLVKTFAALYAHARFIRSNLEYRDAWLNGVKRRLNSNHYLSNLIGLLYISALFPEFRLEEDRNFSASELEKELFEQTLPDGTDYEHSTSYHRLVFEIFLSGFQLLQLNGQPISSVTQERLDRMSQFVVDYLREDGTAPQIGDSDDARLHPLSTRSPNDHRYLTVADPAQDPENWWWFRDNSPLRLKMEPSSRAYSDSGFYIMRCNATQVFVCAATVGMHGLGSHSHNDILSFEYSTDKTAWIVDPGTYLYTPDPEARNLFRSTAYHNTVRVDGLEIDPFLEGQLFQLSDQARITVHEWMIAPSHDVLDAGHNGYMRLSDKVRHRRRFELEKATGSLSIRDSFEGTGTHLLEWFFHVGPSVKVHRDGVHFKLEDSNSPPKLGGEPERSEGGVVLNTKPFGLGTTPSVPLNHLLIEIPSATFETGIIDGWYSPSYGVRQRAPIIVLRLNTSIPFSSEIRIVQVRIP